MKKIITSVLAIVALVGGALYYFRDDIQRQFFKPTETDVQTGVMRKDVEKEGSEFAPSEESDVTPSKEDVKVIATGLDIPWEIVFLDDETMLVTERPGTLLKVTTAGEKTTIQEIEGVTHIGEGGLQGMVLHPQFKTNQWLYLYLTTRVDEGLINRVERYKFDGENLREREIILDGIPGARFHDGGRMQFGPDGYLYITTGDAGNERRTQDRNLLNGKILRIADDGSVPEGNPFGNEVYSYGHRNPQGLAWDNKGRLWSTEHGPSGINSGFDELNLINKGLNYGWPDIIGDEWEPDLETPIIQSGASDTWAPAGAVYWGGSIFFAGLRGESLYEVNIGNIENPKIKSHFKGEFGRLRAVTIGPDGYLYISTSNTDGRGESDAEDDKIIRINPSIFRR